ncbi:MAG: mandelate racemase/muconate lactonizing enzyme family protein [Pseudomonadota bacterium]
MKITAIRATPVNVPLDAPYVWSYGRFPGFTQSIVEIETNEGLIGLGEAPGSEPARRINAGFAEPLIGRDAIDIQGAELAVLPDHTGVQSITDYPALATFGGIELALWDLRGKAWDRTLVDLLGGAVRNNVMFSDYFTYRDRVGDHGGETTIEDIVAYCLAMRETYGSTIFEGKMSDPNPRDAIAMCEALRNALGDDATIRVDSNAAYSLATARMMAPALEDCGIDNWEDPVGTFEEMAALRPHTRLSLSSHNVDVAKAIACGTPDAIVSGMAGNGGILRTQRLIAACEAAHIDFWCYSGDTGIQSAAYIHLIAATPHIRRPSQSLFHMQSLDVIEEGPFRLVNNTRPVPEGPGLGVTLDRDKLAHMHGLFVEQGPLTKYRDPERLGVMRRLPLV